MGIELLIGDWRKMGNKLAALHHGIEVSANHGHSPRGGRTAVDGPLGIKLEHRVDRFSGGEFEAEARVIPRIRFGNADIALTTWQLRKERSDDFLANWQTADGRVFSTAIIIAMNISTEPDFRLSWQCPCGGLASDLAGGIARNDIAIPNAAIESAEPSNCVAKIRGTKTHRV